MSKAKLVIPVLVLGTILVLDIVTKRWALAALDFGGTIRVWNDLVPLTLAFNRGAAFSLSLGEGSRWLFTGVSVLALFALAGLYRGTRADDLLRIFSLSLVSAGAVGNLIDRVRWERGVVDFIGPIDLGFMDWPIFNVADMAITSGAVLLLLSLWREDASKAPAPAVEPAAALPETGDAG